MHNENPSEDAQDDDSWPMLPTETEIYILPDGEIVIADLPVELAAALSDLIQQQKLTPEVSDNSEPSSISHVSD